MKISNSDISEKFVMRFLEPSDYDNGFFECLSNLTVSPRPDRESFEAQFKEVAISKSQVTVVVANKESKKIVGTASIFFEPKYIRNLGCVGHIEDVVVSKDLQGTGIGKQMISQLVQLAQERGCYKCILDCSPETISFYEKCGFKKKEIQMACYIVDSQTNPQFTELKKTTSAI